MAATHQSGNIVGTRQGAEPTIHTVKTTFADPSGVAKKVLTVQGSVLKPGAFQCMGAVVVTASDAATSATLSVGMTPASYNELVTAQNLKSAAGTNFATVANPIKIVTVPTDIFILPTYVGTPTVGETQVFIQVLDVNPAATTNQGD